MSTTDAHLDHVIVAGGGVGGAAAALLLAGVADRVTVLERVASPQAVGAGILLQVNGLAVLGGLGLEAALDARGARIDGIRLHGRRGQVLADEPVPDFGDGLDHLLVLRRSDLAQVLADAMAATPGVEVVFGAKVEGATPDGLVRWATVDGAHDLEADLVVGADGIHSVVRDAGAFGARVSATGSTYVRGLVPTVDDLGGEAWTSLGLFGSIGLGDGTYFYADATHPSVRAALDARDLDALRAAWSAALPASRPVLEAVGSVDDLLVNAVERVDCDTWVDGKLVLLGDAAHSMEPTLGQGANSALVDAAVLAAELRAHPSTSEALVAYDARRRPAVRGVQRDADRLARASRLRSGAARALRDLAVRAAARPGPSAKRYRQVQQEEPRELLAQVRTATMGS